MTDIKKTETQIQRFACSTVKDKLINVTTAAQAIQLNGVKVVDIQKAIGTTGALQVVSTYTLDAMRIIDSGNFNETSTENQHLLDETAKLIFKYYKTFSIVDLALCFERLKMYNMYKSKNIMPAFKEIADRYKEEKQAAFAANMRKSTPKSANQTLKRESMPSECNDLKELIKRGIEANEEKKAKLDFLKKD